MQLTQVTLNSLKERETLYIEKNEKPRKPDHFQPDVFLEFSVFQFFSICQLDFVLKHEYGVAGGRGGKIGEKKSTSLFSEFRHLAKFRDRICMGIPIETLASLPPNDDSEFELSVIASMYFHYELVAKLAESMI